MNNTDKKKRNIIITIAVIAGVIAALVAGLMIKRGLDTKAVNVYPVSALAQENFEDQHSSSSGTVRCEGFQSINVTETQKIKDIYVKEGQTVKAGDAILSYDTTLSMIDVEKAQLNVSKIELSISNAQNELYEINCLTPHYEVLITPDNSNIKFTPVETPFLMDGEGTKDDPMYWLVDYDNVFDLVFFKGIMPEAKNEMYAVFVSREHNAVNGQIQRYFGLYVTTTDTSFAIKPYDASIPDNIEKFDMPEEPYYESYGSDFTEAEIAEMRAEKEAEINDLEIQHKVAALELEKVQKEVSETEAYAREDGVVRTVRDPDEAFKENKPVVEISSNGGFYIDVTTNELELASLKPGDPVNISAYNSGVMCEGEISNVSMFPVAGGNNYFNGNTNVSYYPVTVFVKDDAGLEEGEFAEVTYDSSSTADTSLYIENMFIRQDNGSAYVYAAGADGKLEKRPIKTGKSLWGYYTQIKEGLTAEDRIAFPYGKDVKAGAEINEAEISELYSW